MRTMRAEPGTRYRAMSTHRAPMHDSGAAAAAAAVVGFAAFGSTFLERPGDESSKASTFGAFSTASCESVDHKIEHQGKHRYLRLFSGNGNPRLAQKIAEHMGLSLSAAKVSKFADGETCVQILESVRGTHCYIIQPTCTPVNDNIMELLLMISSLRRSSAKYITAVIPYYGYKRDVGGINMSDSEREIMQDSQEEDDAGDMGASNSGKVGHHTDGEVIVPVSSSDIATMLEVMGVDKVISIDLQAPGEGKIEGFFGSRVPVDSIHGTFAGVEYFRSRTSRDLCIVAPNEACVKKAEGFQRGIRGRGYQWKDGALRKVNVNMAVCIVGGDISGRSRHARHIRSGQPQQEVTVVGDVRGRDCIIVDDMVASGGTAVTRARKLRDAGARRVYLFATHGVFSGRALERIGDSPDIHEVVVTDTVPLPEDYDMKSRGKVVQISVAGVIADVIRRMEGKVSLRTSGLTTEIGREGRDSEDDRYQGQQIAAEVD